MAFTTLIDTGTLSRHLEDPAFAVLDCRYDLADHGSGPREYVAAHLPGARYLHLERDLSGQKTGRNGRHPLPDPAAFAETLGRAGVGPGTQVVAYDAQGGMGAVRLWWMVRWLGHPAVAVLDGGWGKWVAEGRPVSAAVPAPRPATFPARPAGSAVDAARVLSHLGAPDQILLDARAPNRHRGLDETLDPVGGRIPGSRNRFWKDNLDAAGCFKSAAQLREELRAALGGARPEQVVHFCGSGVSACNNLLAFEVAGLPGGKLYPGSWSEWCADPARPTARGEPGPGER
jgi:thiosulfate/3-mercaptopyruvate sulfurtransferase